MAALLRLESFDRAPPMPVPVLTAEDIDAAYERGRHDAANDISARHQREMLRALQDAAEAASAYRNDLIGLRREAADAVAPMLEALLSGALPGVARARLQSVLLAELRQTLETTDKPQLRIDCDPETEPFLAACIASLGLADVALSATAPEGKVTIWMEGGQIAFDRVAMTTDIEAIVQDALKGN